MSLMHIAFETLIRCKQWQACCSTAWRSLPGTSTFQLWRDTANYTRWQMGLRWLECCVIQKLFPGEAHHLSARILYFSYNFLHHHMTYPWAGLDPNKGTSLAPNPSCQSGTKAAKPTQSPHKHLRFLDLSSLVSESRSPLSRLMWVKQCE